MPRDAAAELLGKRADSEDKPEVVGDSAYGDAATRPELEAQGFTITAKSPARNSGGRFPKDRFTVDLDQATVTCPAGQTAVIVSSRGGGFTAPTGPSWNAKSPTSPAAPGAGAAPTPAGWPASPPTLPPRWRP